MKKYSELLSLHGMSPEKSLEILGNKVLETDGKVYSFRCDSGRRVLQLKQDENVVSSGAAFDFESGLKRLIKSVRIARNVKPSEVGSECAHYTTSNIDRWIWEGHSINISAENGDGGFLIGASNGQTDKNILEVNAKKLITAFDWFNAEMGNLNDLNRNKLARVLLSDENNNFSPVATARYEVVSHYDDLTGRTEECASLKRVEYDK